ncbi:MAG: hypothetical protein U1F16_15890 [Turneriella sp.]
MNMINLTATALSFAALIALPSCASSEWREGFVSDDTLYLVGEGHAKPGLSKLQSEALAKEAAVMVAMSHWPALCPGRITDAEKSESENNTNAETVKFRMETQKLRRYECGGGQCRARIVIEKKNLKKICQG